MSEVLPAKKALVAGVSGVVGRAVAQQLAAQGWEVAGLARRPPRDLPGVRPVAADLLDAADAARAVRETGADVTHLVFAALYEPPRLGSHTVEAIERNVAMLRNLFEPLANVASTLEHVTLLHGTKAYGLHLKQHWGEARIPLRERDPRINHENFYFEQEAYLREKRGGASWRLTMLRPTVIYGDALGANMNPMPAIGAYAALLKARGEPLHFPGRSLEPHLQEAVDAGLLARAIAWAGCEPAADGEAFNVTNGDVFLWKNVWPALAEELGMEVGEHRPLRLAETLPERDREWSDIVDHHGLDAPREIVEFAGYNSLVYVDRLLAGMGRPPTPFLNSTIKLRQAGFHECMDTEDMFRSLIRRLQQRRRLPGKSDG